MSMKVATTGVTTSTTAKEEKKLHEEMRDLVTTAAKNFPLTSHETLRNFCSFLTDTLNLKLENIKPGSLILTVHCRTLEILERLWEDYSSGHLDTVVERCFLTDKTATMTKDEGGERSEDDADTVGLETIILKEDYLRCKTFLTELSGKLIYKSGISHLRPEISPG